MNPNTRPRHGKTAIFRNLVRFGQFMIVCCASAVAEGQTLPSSVIAGLKLQAPLAAWDTAQIATADVNCDGVTDTIALAREGDQVAWLAVIPGVKDKKQGEWTVERYPRKFIRIDLSPHTCEGDGETLDGCKPSKHCQDFSLADDETDPLNFYWDGKRRTFDGWSY